MVVQSEWKPSVRLINLARKQLAGMDGEMIWLADRQTYFLSWLVAVGPDSQSLAEKGEFCTQCLLRRENKPVPEAILIYGLVDPRDSIVKYVGQTTRSLKKRLHEHMISSRSDPHSSKSKWIGELDQTGLTPEIIELERVSNTPGFPRHHIFHIADRRERHWITNRNNGQLTNAGVSGRF